MFWRTWTKSLLHWCRRGLHRCKTLSRDHLSSLSKGLLLGPKRCRTKIARLYRIFVSDFRPNLPPNFSRIFRALFPRKRRPQKKKITKNPRQLSVRNPQAGMKKRFTKFVWWGGRATFCTFSEPLWALLRFRCCLPKKGCLAARLARHVALSVLKRSVPQTLAFFPKDSSQGRKSSININFLVRISRGHS